MKILNILQSTKASTVYFEVSSLKESLECAIKLKEYNYLSCCTSITLYNKQGSAMYPHILMVYLRGQLNNDWELYSYEFIN